MATPAEEALERYAEALLAEGGHAALPVDVDALASMLGVRVRRLATTDFAGRLHAAAGGRLVIDLRAADPPVRQRFSCAHELMHTAFRGFGRGRAAPWIAERPAPEAEERLCEHGAAALLMPRALVEGRYELADGLVAVEALARDAAVSLEAAANRLAALAGPPAALLVAERLPRPAERRLAHPPRRLRLRYARLRGIEAFLPPFAPVPRTSALYRALAGRRQRAREPLPGARDAAALFELEARAYGSPRRGLVLAVARPLRSVG